MAGLEAIVRPFQAPTALNTDIVVPRVGLVPASRARVRWGAVGNLPQPSTIQVRSCDTKLKEQPDRKVQTVKIQNPDDPDQYVIVEETLHSTFAKDDPERINITYKTQTMYLGSLFVGPLTTSLSVQTNDNNKQCQDEYSFLDKFALTAGNFAVEADFSPTPWPEF